jgi:hypothetical protein
MPRNRGKSNRSTLDDHKKQGTKLTPPLASLPAMTPASWKDDRLPEMLWAALLITALGRDSAIQTFRILAKSIMDKGELRQEIADITFTGIAKHEPDTAEKVLQSIILTPYHKEALRPLLLLNDLPAYAIWQKNIALEPTQDDWHDLQTAIANTLWHQSEDATDCRWVRIMCLITGGVLQIPQELFEEFAGYPYKGDLRRIRPSIRATEMATSAMIESNSWATQFWQQCLSDTACYPLDVESASPLIVSTTGSQVRAITEAVAKHANATRSTSAPDPRHEISFGIALYALSMLQELLRIGMSQSISARILLRSLSELVITLAYLTHKDTPDLWKSYRIFGSGQAKLTSLKLDAATDPVSFVDPAVVQELANEDMWEEFLQIELGHWEKSNLRKMSEDAGVKSIYDQFYAWTSTFTHGHWGAIRDSNYDICGNALHRLHRIPRSTTRALPDVIPDACRLVDHILDLVNTCYPSFAVRVSQTP